MRTGWPLLLGLLVSCSAADDERDLINLTDRTFVSESLVGRELVPGTEIRLRFDPTGCHATAGCNSMSGVCRFDHDVLVVAALSTTETACTTSPLQEQNNWLAAFLLSRPTTNVAEPRIALTKDLTTLTMLDREIASPDRPLVGTQWIGSGIDNGTGMTASVDSALLSVSFGADGTFQAFSGCKRASGSVVQRNATIYFTALTYDNAVCPDSDLETLSAPFLFVLNGMEATFAIEERLLTISRAGMTLYFTSAL
jgi:heat shock protein HslJ